MKKYDDFFLTELIMKSNIDFISGKFFYEKNEIKNIDKYLGKIYYNHCHKMVNERDLKYMKNGLINNPLSEDQDFWPRPKIIDEAMELMAEGYNPKQIPFPLDDKQLLILYILLFHPEQEAFFITTGIGGSGKSTYLNIIRQLFDNDVSSTPLGDLGEPFILAEALKHRLIASDELGKGEVDLPVIKTIVSKQKIQVNEKFGSTYTTQSQSALFFCCNKAPKLDITDTGILRRIVYYSRNSKILNPNPTFKSKIYTHEDLVDFVIYAYKVGEWIYKDDDIDAWKEWFKLETNVYLCNSNNVGLFYKECKRKGMLRDVESYKNYRDYCYDNGYKPYNRQNYDEILIWVKENYADEESLKKDSTLQLPF